MIAMSSRLIEFQHDTSLTEAGMVFAEKITCCQMDKNFQILDFDSKFLHLQVNACYSILLTLAGMSTHTIRILKHSRINFLIIWLIFTEINFSGFLFRLCHIQSKPIRINCQIQLQTNYTLKI